jgi:NAD(P)-dependent dehydrogenase (short-subunit alcohol dehydrogenase family)
VRWLAQKGAKVVIADVSDERGEALASEVGAGSLYVPTDWMDEDAIAKAVKTAGEVPRREAEQTLCRSGGGRTATTTRSMIVEHFSYVGRWTRLFLLPADRATRLRL